MSKNTAAVIATKEAKVDERNLILSKLSTGSFHRNGAMVPHLPPGESYQST
jgi:hypothetical protein